MIILVINCGSSSIKYQLLDMKNDDVFDIIAKGIAEKIGLPAGILQYAPTGRDKIVKDIPIPDHKVGMELILAALTDPETGVLSSLEDIEAVGHRIVQGGDFFSGSVLVDDDVLEKIAFCSDFAPLHNYGAHGTSHQFVAGVGAKLAGLDLENSKIITCHLGAGSSICAIQNGKCVDTSMGFSPLEGMIMGTRVGNIDANAVIYLENKLGVTPDEMSTILNRKSGFLGVSEYSSDCRELDERANNGDPKAKLALKKFTYDIIKNVGSYVAAMNGVDLIVFTGGIGEHNSRLRRRVLENFSYLGLKVDYEANVAFGEDAIITTADSKVKAALICTNEELVIARDTMHIALQNQD